MKGNKGFLVVGGAEIFPSSSGDESELFMSPSFVQRHHDSRHSRASKSTQGRGYESSGNQTFQRLLHNQSILLEKVFQKSFVSDGTFPLLSKGMQVWHMVLI